MKKFLSFILVILLCVSYLASCDKTPPSLDASDNINNESKLEIPTDETSGGKETNDEEPEPEPDPEPEIETVVEEPEIEIEAEDEQRPEVVAVVEEDAAPVEEAPIEEAPVEEAEEKTSEVENILASIPTAAEEAEDPNKVEAIDIIWEERTHKTYRYDPDGNDVE